MYNKVLITGGSGFLGSHLIPQCKQNYKVLAPRSRTFNLYDFNDTLGYIERHKPEVIIHGAAYYGGIKINIEEPADIFYRNTAMTNNLYAAASKSKSVKKIIQIGSACAYPGCITGDMKEEDFWNGELHHSVESYGFSKKIQLVAQKSYHKQYGLEGNHLSLTNLYGENDVFTEYRSHVVAALIKRFSDEKHNPVITNWGDGSAIREFIYVKDAAQAIVEFIDQPHDLKPINIGTGVGTSIKKLAELTAKYMNFHGALDWDTSKPNGVPRKVLDTTRMKEKLPNFKPLPFEVGLKATIDWYLKNKKEADARK